MSKHTRTYIRRYGGCGSTADDMWYDEDIITVVEGDTCPECGKGKMKVSRKGNLYCSAICWRQDLVIKEDE